MFGLTADLVFSFLPLFFWTTSGQSLLQDQICQTVNSIPCVFPFIYKNITYAGCTEVEDQEKRPWCSTMVDSSGTHVQFAKRFGHCTPGCPNAKDRLTPACDMLSVTDLYENSTSEYGVAKDLSRGGRTVYVNADKELYIFWLDEENGWGLGYKEGILSGGAIYSSGPELLDEPWQGAWRDKDVKVACGGQLPFLRTVNTVPGTERNCPQEEACLKREDCPSIDQKFKEFLGHRRDDPNYKEKLKDLQALVCNKREKALCCPANDNSVCEIGLRCQPIKNCRGVEKQIQTLMSNKLTYKESVTLYRRISHLVCDMKNQMFCCDGK